MRTFKLPHSRVPVQAFTDEAVDRFLVEGLVPRSDFDASRTVAAPGGGRFIATPMVLAHVRAHFACADAEGGLTENGDPFLDVPATVGHWEHGVFFVRPSLLAAFLVVVLLAL